MNTTVKNTSTKKVATKLSVTELLKATTEKIATPKKTNLERQNDLINKEDKTTFDWVKLANVTDKIEDKTISKVYKNCIKNVYLKNITGLTKTPTFEDFKAKMSVKETYSNWDGYKALAKFNVKNNTAAKVKRQNKKEAKK